MLKRNQVIVMKCIKYGESSIITQALTPEDGIVPLIVSGVRSKKSRGKSAHFQIGQILDVVYYDKQKEGVMRLKESSIHWHYKSISGNIVKIALIQYVIELTRNCIYQSGISSDGVFSFLKQALLHLDLSVDGHTNLGVYYLWNLIACLGIAPNLDQEQLEFLDLESGDFSRTLPLHQAALSKKYLQTLQDIFETPLEHVALMKISSNQRKELLIAGHRYLSYHLSYFKVPKSVEMFREILRL